METLSCNEYGLSQRDMDTIAEIFSKYPMIHQVNLFGSRAIGRFNHGSDLDLALMDDISDLFTLMKLKDDFSESSLPFRVDIISLSSIKNPELIEHIQRVGKIIYQDKPY